MKAIEYVEYTLLRTRLSILDKKLPDYNDFEEVEFSLKEVQDIDALISSLQSIRKVYDEQ
ncbi:MAG: hypothetical protein ACR652_14660 [Methylocystis sp.]|uniref:hypothetical protein n=1 Tax=Methylocystis sp. TaxID=1911079 RepID=UPI003DA22C8C